MTGPEFESKDVRRGTKGGGDELVPVIFKTDPDKAQMIGRVIRRSSEFPELRFVDLVDISGIPKILQVDAAAIKRNLELLADHGVEPCTVINGSAPQPPEGAQQAEPVDQVGPPLYPISRKKIQEGGILFTPDGPLVYKTADDVPQLLDHLGIVRPTLDPSPTHSPTVQEQMLGRTLQPQPPIVNTAPSESSDQPPLITTAGIPGGDEFSVVIIDESHHYFEGGQPPVQPPQPEEGAK